MTNPNHVTTITKKNCTNPFHDPNHIFRRLVSLMMLSIAFTIISVINIQAQACDSGITTVSLTITDPTAVLCIGDSQPCGGLAANGTPISSGNECCNISGNNSCAILDLTFGSMVGGVEIDIFGANSYEVYTLSGTGAGTTCTEASDPSEICSSSGSITLLVCKPGASWNNSIGITAIGAPTVSDVDVYETCNTNIIVEGAADYTIVWSSVDDPSLSFINCTTCPTPNFNYTGPTITSPTTFTYTATLTYTGAGCGADVVLESTVTVYPLLDATIDYSCTGNMATMDATPLGGSGNYTYQWSNAVGEIDGETTSSYTSISSGTFSVEICDIPNCGCITRSVTPVCCSFDVECFTTTSAPTVQCASLLPMLPADPLAEFLDLGGTINDMCGTILATVSDTDVVGACPEEITRTRRFIVFDDTGDGAGGAANGTRDADELFIMCDFVYTSEDTVDPSITMCPGDLILECGDTGNAAAVTTWLATFMATDDCGTAPMLTNDYGGVLPAVNCPGTNGTLVTFTATDQCSNTATCTAQIIVDDTMAPTIDGCPTPLVLECGSAYVTLIDAWVAAAITSIEAASTDPNTCSTLTASSNYVTGAIPSVGCAATATPLTVTFIVEDACGNFDMCSANVTIVDATVPSIVCPDPIAVTACDPAAGLAVSNWLLTATATDDCDNEVTITNDFDGDLSSCMSSIDVTFTATDDCGLTSTCVVAITINMADLPTLLYCPSDVSIALDAGAGCTPSAAYTPPNAIDDCGIVSTTLTSGPVSGASTGWILGDNVITYEITNSCGKVSVCTWTINLFDSSAPMITCPGTINLCAPAGSCEVIAPALEPTIMVCDGNSTLTYVITGATTGTGTGSITGLTFNLGISEVTYTVTKDSNPTLKADCDFLVIVEDCEPPVIMCPADNLAVACGTENIAVWAAGASAVDDAMCSVSEIEYVLFSQSELCGETQSSTYLFTATDDAGNSSTCLATYATVDMAAPVINVAAAASSAECGPGAITALLTWVADNGGASATDACSEEVFWTNNFDGALPSTCGITGAVTVNFIVSDACGNMSTTQATFAITDTQVPVITCPENISLECNDENTEEIVLNWLSSAYATDGCDAVTVSNNYTALPACGSSVDVTFTVEDNCDGTVVTCIKTISIVDTQKPIIMVAPNDLIIECDGSGNTAEILTWETAFGNMVAMDVCDPSPVLSFVKGTTIPLCGGTQVIPYTFTATDACGNLAITEVAYVHIIDTTAPVLSVPFSPGSAVCSTEFPSLVASTWAGTEAAAAHFTDDCSAVTTDYELISYVLTCGSTGIYTYEFRGNDACGNQTIATSTFTVTDAEVPVFTFTPAALTIDCDDISNTSQVTIGNWLNSAIASDACDPNITITNDYTNTTLDVCTGGGVTTVTWTATDACDNMSTTSSTITITPDATPPIMVAPSDLTLPCTDLETTASSISTWLASVNASDLCDSDVEVVNNYTNFNINLCTPGTTAVTWTATDNCDNTTVVMANIIITGDETAPLFTFTPAALTIGCDDISNTSQVTIGNWLNSAIATDLCDPDITITNDYTATSLDVCTGGGTTTVTWTAIDACENSSTTTSSITVTEDTTPPIMVAPTDLTLPCTDLETTASSISSWLLSVNASDLCDSDVEVVNNYTNFNINLCTPGTTTVTWTATDNCDNTTTVMADIIITGDETAPLFTFTPAALSIDCDDVSNTSQVTIDNWLNSAIATDLCDPDITITNDYTATSLDVCTGGGTTTVTWTAIDACGNSSTTTSTITVTEDTTPPIMVAPTDLTLPCTDLETTASSISSWLLSVNASDLCDSDVEVVNNYTNFNINLCTPGTTTVTWTATDNCDNTTTVMADIIITGDETAPLFTFTPAALTIDCDDISNTSQVTIGNWLNSAIATDLCDPDITITNDYTATSLDVCTGGGTTTVTWTAIDACGNSSTTTSTITVTEDTTPPIMVAPTDLTLPCTDLETTASSISSWLLSVNASDLCDSDVEVVNNYTNFNINLCTPGTTTVTWTATDNCDNTTTVMADIIITGDETAPLFTFTPAALTIDCADVSNTSQVTIGNWLNSAIATDLCDPDITITNDYTATSLDICTGGGTTTVTWTAIDACGNSSTTTSSITVTEDTTPPIMVAPTDLTLPCTDLETTASSISSWLLSVNASDLCDSDVEVVNNYTNFNINLCTPGTTTVTWTATDNCDNTTTVMADLIIEGDITPPTILTEAMSINVECNGANNSSELLGWLNNNGGAIAIDDCNEVEWSNDYNNVNSDCGEDGVVVIFTATDLCGNFSTTEATFIIDDNLPPIWEIAPQDLILECNDMTDPYGEIDAWLNIAGGGEAEDSCSFIVYSNNFNGFSDGCGNTGTAIVIFTATDACGNSTDTMAVVTLVDNTAPNLLVPAQDTTVSCDGAGNMADLTAWLDAYANVMFEDACSTPLNYDSLLIQTTPGCGMTTELTYAFFATDACDNISEQSIATFTIIDTTAAIIVAGADLIVECDGTGNTTQRDAWLANNGGATAADICSEPLTWAFDLITEVDSCGNTGSQTYLFTVTDDCGNTSTTTGNFIIEDTTVPMIVDQAVPFMAECNGSSNSAEILSWLNNNGGATATDICGGISWTNDYGSIISDCGTTGDVLVTFTATDDCGNTSTSAATFTINDNTPPTWEIAPQDLTLECNDMTDPYGEIDAWLLTVGGGEAEDSCSLVVYTNDFAGFSDGCGNTGMATVTFTATDACGNSTDTMAVVTLVDNTAPNLLVPAQDTTDSCDGAGNVADLTAWLDAYANVIFEDACSTPLNYDSLLIETTPGCGMTTTLTYAFFATDACDNISEQSIATFTVIDTTSPLVIAAADMTVECNGIGNNTDLDTWLADNGGATASDICGGELTWSYDLVQESDLCDLTGSGLYRFTVLDECGNTSTTEATFEIEDTEAPVITAESMPITVVCDGNNNITELLDWLNSNGGAEATDNCNEVIWTNNYGQVDPGSCTGSGSITITFTATDGCGNASMTTATLTITDEVAPIWTIEPTDLTLECTDDIDPMDAIQAWLDAAGNGDAFDSCSVVVYTNDFVALTPSCGANNTSGSADVIFTATDACGNATPITVTVTVEDTTGPDVTSPAVDETVECDGAGNTADLEAWLLIDGGATFADLCGENTPDIPVLVETIEGCGLTIEYVYSFASTDACGNTSVATIASFIIIDTTSPAIDPAAMDMTVECDGEGNDGQLDAWLEAVATAGATDACSDEVLIWEYDLVADEDSCGITGIQIFRFTVFDNCGNSSTSEGTFTIEDTTPPMITGGENYSGECDQSNANNDDELLSWLNNRGGAEAEDMCGTMVWSNNYNVDNFVDGCNDSRNIDVIFTATDECGNFSEITLNFSTGDNTPPEFTNCPRPPVVVDAPEGWCNSFVNFSLPLATDNCGTPIVEQTDNTGLSTGDLFPVGLTLLEFTATDSCGNSTTCELKIIVNDFHTPPTINCPVDQIVDTDPAMCGTVVDGIEPFDIVDNCPDNIAVTYIITDESGAIIDGGLEDASGTKFPEGINTVTYTVYDQPIILITEVMNDGGEVGIEISNFGPGSMDISCMDISREGIQDTTLNVPNGTVVGVGDVYTVFFPAADVALGAGYTIGLLDNIIDGVAVNGYMPTNWTFDGSLSGSNVFRSRFPDTDSADDWSVGNSCAGLSFGFYNPELPVFPDNGTTSSLQSAAPNSASCSFTITVIDNEAPYCADLELTDYPSTDTPIAFTNGACATSVINVTDVFNVSDVNIIDLEGIYPNMNEVTVTLTSPLGTVVTLFDGLCAGTADWDIDLDDQATDSQASITCNPLGNGDAFQSLQSMGIFYGEAAFGDWALDVYATGIDAGELTTWTLQLSELTPYSQTDTTLVNDTLVCGAIFEWQHPFIGDNCEAGSITVEYIFIDDNTINNGPAINIEAGSLESIFFPVGTTQIIYTLTDAAGNTSQCGFDVTVLDNEKPDLSLADICNGFTIQLEPGECTQSLDFGGIPPGATDNCAIDSVSYDPPADFDFPIGTTAVTVTVYDAAGNSQSCTFDVVVLEFDNGGNTSLACNNNINLSLGPDCMAEVTADMILEGNIYGCYDDYCIEATTASGIVVDNIFDLTDVGQTFTITITDCLGSGNSCWGYVTIEHKLIPEIACAPDTIISCNMATNPEFTGYPTVLTCEQDVQMTYFDDYEDFGPCGEPRARITREWTVTDESDNVVTCTQVIDIEQFDTEDIEFPADYTLATGLDCALVANDPTQIHPDSTGYPTINGLDVPLSTNGLCMLSWNWNDQILFSCEGSYEILRKWFIRDMCEEVQIGVNPIEHYQIIKILDTEGPVIHDCPSDVIVSTDPWSCTGTYELADIISTIDDNCGGVEQVQVSVNGGTVVDNVDGTFTITNMNKGDHLVRVRARDYCYNYSTCEFTITVFDGTAPVVTCTQFINISLTTDGKAKMFTESVDAGSFDNCTSIRSEVFRMDDNCGIAENTEPGLFVEFCCADIEASPIMVALQVWDDANMDGIIGNEGDNSSLCMVEVTVEDKLPPAINCPADITLECYADVTDLSVTGKPIVVGTCNSSTATYEDFKNDINDCGAAIINRRWSVDGRPDIFCTQNIVLEASDPFNGNIQWPADWEGACLDNIPQNEPIYIGGACDQVGYIVAIDTFDFVEDVCYKLIKEWTVIDWCQYEPNNPNTGGIWMHTQIIKISDDTAPEVQQCADITIDLTGENCTQDITLTNTAMDSVCGINAPIRWAYQLDLDADGIWDIELDYNDNTPDDILEGDEASVLIKNATPGNYKIAWTAFDGCGNVGSCQYDIVIRDGKSPTPYCIDIATALMQDVGTVSIWANDFNLASFDNCTAEGDLLYSFSGDSYVPSMEFSCDDIPNGISETVELEMWVWDEAGNKDFCLITLDLQDNLGQCQDTLTNLAIISGRVATEEAEPVNVVDVTLNSFAPEYPYTNTSNENGEFYFLYSPTGYDFVATAERNTDYREGVSTLDLVMIQRHILELQALDSPYKIIAGDVNDDERLTASDLLAMRKLILGVTTSWNNKSWRFVNTTYDFPDAEDPFPYDEKIEVIDLMENINDADLVAVKVGDVNGSASTNFNNAKEGTTRTNPTQTIILEKAEIDGKQYIEFKASTDGTLFGLQFGAENNGFDIKGLQRGLLDVSPDMIRTTSKRLRMSWSNETGVPVFAGQVLFRIAADATTDFATLTILADDIVTPEIYMNALEINNLEFEWRNDNTATADVAFRLYQNEPNPFIDATQIGFYMPEAGEATFRVYDVDGKLILSRTAEYEAGENVINVSAEDIGVKGMVVYEVSGNSFSGTRKMIVVE